MFQRRSLTAIATDPVIELFDIGYDQKTDCITFPIRDMQGRCLFVARRSVKTKFFNYPSKAEKPLYGLYEYRKVKDQAVPDLPVRGDSSGLEWGNAVIVCESMLDALTAWGYGKPALAMNGLGTELQFKQLRSLPCRKIILATDADSAGMSARVKIRKNVPNKIITEYIWDIKDAKDLNDMDEDMFNSLEEFF